MYYEIRLHGASKDVFQYISCCFVHAFGDKAGGRRGVKKKMSVNRTHKKMFDLLPETNYSVVVKAVTSAGQGPGQSVIATTRQYARQYIQFTGDISFIISAKDVVTAGVYLLAR